MHIPLLPSPNDVLSQLENIAAMNASFSHSRVWTSTACKEIYSHIEMHLESSDFASVKEKFDSHPGLVWTGSEFINPSSIAQNGIAMDHIYIVHLPLSTRGFIQSYLISRRGLKLYKF